PSRHTNAYPTAMSGNETRHMVHGPRGAIGTPIRLSGHAEGAGSHLPPQPLWRSRMQLGRTLTGRVALTVAALTFAACTTTERATGPNLPPPPPDNPQLTKASFIFHVNTRSGAIQIEAPAGTENPGPSAPIGGTGRGGRDGKGGPRMSLIAGDAI